MTQVGPIRGIATLFVVVAHVVAYCALALTWWAHRYGGTDPDWTWLASANWWALTAFRQLALFSIPLFLVCSGFYVSFATRGNPANATWKTARGWVLVLVRPFAVWVSIATIVTLAGGYLSQSPAPVDQVVLDAARIRSFIVILAGLFVVTPLLARIAFKHSALFVAGWIVLDVLQRTLDYSQTLWAMLPGGVYDFVAQGPLSWLLFWGWGSFFGLGLVLGKHYRRVRPALVRFRWQLALIALALFGASMLEAYAFVQFGDPHLIWAPTWALSSYVYALVVAVAVFGWDIRRSRVGHQLEQLGTHTYAIYMIHYLVIDLLAKLTYHLAPQILPRVWLFLPLLMLSGIAGPLLLMWITSRSPLRKYQRVLFGSFMQSGARTTARSAPAARATAAVAHRGV